MAKRKTIDVDFVRNKVNHLLLHSHDGLKAIREGNCFLLETILHETGNYKGYSYLYSHHMEKSENGTSVGIIFDESPARNHVFPDDSRRYYN